VRLTVAGLEAHYGSSQVLFGVDMHVADGETVALIGRNGAGKTTTLHCVMGVVSARRGSIRLDERETIGLPPHRIARLGVGLVPQGRRIFAELTVEENLRAGIGSIRAKRLGARLGHATLDDSSSDRATLDGAGSRGTKHDGAGTRHDGAGSLGTKHDDSSSDRATLDGAAGGWTLEQLFDVFPLLAKVRKSKGGWLSGGEQQVLSIARALIADPGVLLLDEPTEGLAPRVVETLTEQLLRIKRAGLTMVLAEQHLGLVVELAGRAYVIDRGVVRVEGEPAVLLADDQVRHAYLSL
jgi:branched-chain amino acid transport system ATP-binding protein